MSGEGEPRTCVDRGGTFTDLVRWRPGGRATIDKVRSDRAVVGDLASGEVTFGTTVATNALLERRGVPTLLVVTEGFADLARIRDMTRPEVLDPDVVWPEPLATRVIEVRGRLDADGREVEPLELPERWDVDGVDGDARRPRIAAVAVVLLHAPRDPSHERAVADAIRAAHPELYVVVGADTCPEVGYLARIETTLVQAAITPVLAAALRRDRVDPSWLAVRSDASLCPASALTAADAVLSGPATGVLAVAHVARLAGVDRAIGLDMGGTSTDVCLVDVEHDLGGAPRLRDGATRVAGAFVRRPMRDVRTIGCGGGSILWTDGIRLGVGPRSAGADPGPQCAGAGPDSPPTVTDAALVAGLLDPTAFSPPLDPDRVALPALGDGSSPNDAAQAFLGVARAQIADAIRALAASYGVDPRAHDLVAFGGAAGQHAAWVAELLGARTVWVHPAAAVMCAWGQALARREASAVRALWAPYPEADPAVRAAIDAMSEALPALGEVHATLALRHLGTDHAIAVPYDPRSGDGAVEAIAAFHAAHRAQFGFDRAQPLEVVDVRVRVVGPAGLPPDVPPFDLGGRDRDADSVDGPTRIDLPTTSVTVPAGWTARLERGMLRLDRADAGTPALPTARSPAAVAVWGSRFMSVAERAGAVLVRTARSVNIRERRDLSCAVFDGAGNLVANAPHVPVHLGAMGDTVRALIGAVGDRLGPGQHWLTNDPGAGGSHLPDLTVVSPVDLDGHRMFVGCRAHHVDVGGSTPGSMPPASRSLAEEGFVVRHLPLVGADGALRADLADHLAGCRALDTVVADLEAQIAANLAASRWLAELGPGAVVAAWARHLQDTADESLAAVLASLPDQAVAEDRIDGVPLRVRLVRDGQGLVVDLGGTGGPHPGNLNAPAAVVRAAVLYALRVLAGQPIPLNDGALRRVRIVRPAGSIVDPPVGAAVAGGNVETSQRLVDLVLRAAGCSAGSAGTMNNLTLGGDGWQVYETIGGGQGASPRGPGPSGRQIHMTNTRATDPEVLEHRLPLRLVAFSLRRGSGGTGVHPGGDGLVREVEALAPATAALLRSRRRSGAPGLAGGGSGVPGEDAVRIDGRWRAWDGEPVALGAGDRVRIATPGGGGWGRAR